MTGPDGTSMVRNLGIVKAYLAGYDETVRMCLDTAGRWIYAPRMTRFTVYLRVEFTMDTGHHNVRYHVSTSARTDQLPGPDEIWDHPYHCAGLRPIITGLSSVRSKAVGVFSQPISTYQSVTHLPSLLPCWS